MNKPKPWVRRITELDLPQAIAINRDNAPDMTKAYDIEQMVSRGDTYILVAGHYSRVDGFIIVTDQGNVAEIVHMAVAGDCTRRGVGTAMIDAALELLDDFPFEAWVRETNLAAQLFLKAMGFRCVDIYRDAYKDSRDSAYLFALDRDDEWDQVDVGFRLKKAN